MVAAEDIQMDIGHQPSGYTSADQQRQLWGFCDVMQHLCGCRQEILLRSGQCANLLQEDVCIGMCMDEEEMHRIVNCIIPLSPCICAAHVVPWRECLAGIASSLLLSLLPPLLQQSVVALAAW